MFPGFCARRDHLNESKRRAERMIIGTTRGIVQPFKEILLLECGVLVFQLIFEFQMEVDARHICVTRAGERQLKVEVNRRLRYPS